MDMVRDLLGLTDVLLKGIVASAGLGMLVTAGLTASMAAQIEASASEEGKDDGGSDDMATVKVLGAKILKGEFDVGLMEELRKLLRLTDAVLVKSVRCLNIELLRKRGVGNELLAPLEEYDVSQAAGHIEDAKLIGCKIIKGQIDGELATMMRGFLSLDDDVAMSMMQGAAIGLLRAQGVAESQLDSIEMAIEAGEAKIQADAALTTVRCDAAL